MTEISVKSRQEVSTERSRDVSMDTDGEPPSMRGAEEVVDVLSAAAGKFSEVSMT